MTAGIHAELTVPFDMSRNKLEELAGSREKIVELLAALQKQVPSGSKLLADWVKPPFGNHQTRGVRSPAILEHIIQGVFRNRCTELKFFAVPADWPESERPRYS